MSDIKCLTCGEPWDTYHLQHDMKFDVLELVAGRNRQTTADVFCELFPLVENGESDPVFGSKLADTVSEEQIYEELELRIRNRKAEDIIRRARRVLPLVNWEFKSSKLFLPLKCPCCPDTFENYSPMLTGDLAIARDAFDCAPWIQKTMRGGWHVDAFKLFMKAFDRDAWPLGDCWVRAVVWEERTSTLRCVLGLHRPNGPMLSHVVSQSSRGEPLLPPDIPPEMETVARVVRRRLETLVPQLDQMRRARLTRMAIRHNLQPRELVVELGGKDSDGIAADIEDLGL